MHLTRELLYLTIGLLAGGLGGTVFGFCLFGAWLLGWIFSVPDSLAGNDLLAEKGRARSKLDVELPFAWSDRHQFIRDEIGNVTYRKIPYAGDGEG